MKIARALPEPGKGRGFCIASTQFVDIQLARLTKRLAVQKLTLTLTDAAKEYLADKGYDPVYGARPLKRAIQRDLFDPLSLELLAGHFHGGQTIHADARDGRIVFTT